MLRTVSETCSLKFVYLEEPYFFIFFHFFLTLSLTIFIFQRFCQTFNDIVNAFLTFFLPNTFRLLLLGSLGKEQRRI